MVSMKIVVVDCDKNGNVDMVDFKVKVEEVFENLFCIMIIYLFIYGVYEEIICEICDIVY